MVRKSTHIFLKWHKITGQGTMTYANGDKYEGEWLNGILTAVQKGQKRHRVDDDDATAAGGGG